MSYDPRCLELAEYFLADEPTTLKDRASELAEHIQSEIETWIEYEQREHDTNWIEHKQREHEQLNKD